VGFAAVFAAAAAGAYYYPKLTSSGADQDAEPAKAEAILAMRLQQLTGLEADKLIAEYTGLKADIAGYEALLAGKDKVISGFMNKVQVELSNVLPDRLVAAGLHKMAGPVDGDESAHQS